jgi:hypothetical protein
MSSKEGNAVSPYIHNGSYFVHEYPNVFEVTKRGYNYLYKSHRSGYKPKTNDLPGYTSGFVVQWNRESALKEPREFAGYSMFFHHEGDIVEEKLITRVLVGSEVLFDVYAISSGPSEFSIEARDQFGMPYTNLQWYVSGKTVTLPVFNTMEWYMLQCSLPEPHDSDGEVVSLLMTGKQTSFDNITIHGRQDAVVRGVTVYRRWSDLIANNWGFWTTEDWRTLYDVGTVIGIDIERERMSNMLTGLSPEVQFNATVGANFQETFVIRDIEWANMDVSAK